MCVCGGGGGLIMAQFLTNHILLLLPLQITIFHTCRTPHLIVCPLNLSCTPAIYCVPNAWVRH